MTPTATKKHEARDLPPHDLATALAAPVALIADLGWAAGFIDGEGCISAVWQRYKDPTRRTCIRIKLQVAQNDYSSLRRLQNILGVQSEIVQLKRTQAQNRPVYSLNFDTRHAIGALLKVAPFLHRKKMEAETCFQLWVEGMMGVRFGPKPIPEEIWAIREKYLLKLQRLK